MTPLPTLTLGDSIRVKRCCWTKFIWKIPKMNLISLLSKEIQGQIRNKLHMFQTERQQSHSCYHSCYHHQLSFLMNSKKKLEHRRTFRGTKWAKWPQERNETRTEGHKKGRNGRSWRPHLTQGQSLSFKNNNRDKRDLWESLRRM